MTEIQSTTNETTRRRNLTWWVALLAFLLLTGFLALIAWGLNRTQEGPITVGSKVPDFTLTTFDGKEIHTADYAGKVILINFWASWCSPCEQEAADLEAAWRLYQDNGQVIFLGVDYVDTEPEATSYMQRYQISYPSGPDLRTEISQMFRTAGVPETYIVGRDGKLKYARKGPFNSVAEIQSVLDPILK